MGVLGGNVLENRFSVKATHLRQTFKDNSAELGDRPCLQQVWVL